MKTTKLEIDTENKTTLPLIKAELQILELGLKGMTKGMDDLITACMSEDGPTRQDIARARGLLPSGYINSFQPKAKQ